MARRAAHPGTRALRACLLLAALCLALAAGDQRRTLLDENSNIIPTAGAVKLANGNGDVNPSGACASDAKAFCSDVDAGEGRLAACLTKQQTADKKGNTAGKKVSEACATDLADFKIARSKNINLDVPLARACTGDAAKLCGDVSDAGSPGAVLSCLRGSLEKLGSGCKAEVARTQLEALDDYRTDARLAGVCGPHVKALCKDVEAGEGREVECLNAKSMQVTWDCLGELLRNEKEAGDDIRLSVKLYTACVQDAAKFCKDVEPGHMRVQECLEDKMDRDGFSADCHAALDEQLARRVSDFRLDSALRDACAADLQAVCGASLKEMDGDAEVRASALDCLQSYRSELASEACRAEVHRRMSRASRDIRFDEVLANACFEDRNKYCAEVAPGSARVIRCLQDHRGGLAQKCGAALFDHEVRMAEDIDFKYPMKRACAYEVSLFCKDVPQGHARVIRCLETKVDDADMSKECRDEVMRDMNRMATDYRLNFRLSKACEADIGGLCPALCAPGAPCGGLVLQCLQQKVDNITASECQEEVFYYQLMEVSDFRNDVILAEACRSDVDAYCSHIEPGEGRVHACLRFNREAISERCRAEELKLQAVEMRDIRLRPRLAKLCSEERAVFCKDVQPGRARVVKCLMAAMAKPSFGADCKAELEKREDAVKGDYRYDVGVATACRPDIDALCAEAKTKLRGNATVLKCLAERYKSAGEGCQAEMSRAVRLALWDYKPAAPLTAVCDSDVQEQCPMKSKRGGMFTIGAVGRCLSKTLVEHGELEAGCRSLVLLAAPKDSRAYFEYPDSASNLVRTISDYQRAAGLDGVLVDAYARQGSGVTVTGWLAAACVASLLVVSLAGLWLAYRNVMGLHKPHTQFVKEGDA